MTTRPASILSLGFAAFVVLAGCAKDPVACSPATAGLGDLPRLVRQDLPGIDSKPDCNANVQLVRNAADQRAAYLKLGLQDVPTVDYATQTLVLREQLDTRPIAWIVVKDATVTIGSQACAGAAAGTCAVAVFTLDAVVTKAEAYACEDIGCSGASVGDGTN